MGLSNLQRLIANSTKKEVDIPTSFIADFKYTIIQKNEEDYQKPTPTYKPSSLRCIRNMYFQRAETDIDKLVVNPSIVGIAESGTDRHERIQYWITQMEKYISDFKWLSVRDYLTESGLIEEFDIVSEGKFETKLHHKKLNLRFLCDGLIEYKGHKYILEIKTETSSKWFNRNSVNEAHKEQAVAYATMFNINDVMFMYENRDFCDWKVFIFHVTNEMKKTLVIDPILLCEQYVEAQQVPPIPDNAGDSLCKYCDYKLLCKEIGQDNGIKQD